MREVETMRWSFYQQLHVRERLQQRLQRPRQTVVRTTNGTTADLERPDCHLTPAADTRSAASSQPAPCNPASRPPMTTADPDRGCPCTPRPRTHCHPQSQESCPCASGVLVTLGRTAEVGSSRGPSPRGRSISWSRLQRALLTAPSTGVNEHSHREAISCGWGCLFRGARRGRPAGPGRSDAPCTGPGHPSAAAPTL